MTDYRDLLKKYMTHILNEERMSGTVFRDIYLQNPDIFTKEDWATLKKLEEEVEKDLYD
jgi:hypothetical protein